jgi:hypothetical protein
MYVTVKQLFERIRDAYGDPNDLLEAIGLSYGELLELLNDEGLLTKEALPFVYDGTSDEEDYKDV